MSTQSELNRFFDSLWADYSRINPQAAQIHRLLEECGEKVENDHIAFRTFDDPRVNLEVFERLFQPLGYEVKGEYRFPVKKLKAVHFENKDPQFPKIFVSELLSSQFSDFLQTSVQKFLSELDSTKMQTLDFCFSGRPWEIDSVTYEKLAAESEYAGWLSAFGFRANHFTVNVNALQSFSSMADLNLFLKQAGFTLNTSGGEIKGSPQLYLEQSSTMAAKIDWDFSDKRLLIPSCYYEFALRYPDSSGALYQGFVTDSADKIFESTDRKSTQSA